MQQTLNSESTWPLLVTGRSAQRATSISSGFSTSSTCWNCCSFRCESAITTLSLNRWMNASSKFKLPILNTPVIERGTFVNPQPTCSDFSRSDILGLQKRLRLVSEEGFGPDFSTLTSILTNNDAEWAGHRRYDHRLLTPMSLSRRVSGTCEAGYPMMILSWRLWMRS